MESLFLCPTPQGGRVYLYAVPDGVPLYFKQNELAQEPGYRLLWRGSPTSIPEHEAASLVAKLETPDVVYRNYHYSPESLQGFGTAKESFQSAVERLGQQLEYAPGTYPTEVLVGEIPAS
ncbi:hypothetical protein [Hymenobacter sp. YC55]|uniref:hypothetical protein n=1 Tax=Hymenobacter sp. YC55 TaxID=3034019 RepID=UPI0023F85C66|nr:hypothetical protein [Hymenobacter sp. YC55]MDF7812848.1 hypothetical protein [Hymenobacter sp. YC55]